jgi:hypothetical protein
MRSGGDNERWRTGVGSDWSWQTDVGLAGRPESAGFERRRERSKNLEASQPTVYTLDTTAYQRYAKGVLPARYDRSTPQVLSTRSSFPGFLGWP